MNKVCTFCGGNHFVGEIQIRQSGENFFICENCQTALFILECDREEMKGIFKKYGKEFLENETPLSNLEVKIIINRFMNDYDAIESKIFHDSIEKLINLDFTSLFSSNNAFTEIFLKKINMFVKVVNIYSFATGYKLEKDKWGNLAKFLIKKVNEKYCKDYHETKIMYEKQIDKFWSEYNSCK